MIKNSYTLYHGTIKDHEQSIRDYGLEPQVGAWVDQVLAGSVDLEDEDLDNHGLVFAADKSRFGMAVYAMLWHVANKLGKSANEVTEEDIVKHGMLVIIKNGEEYFHKRPKEDDQEWWSMQQDIEYEIGNPLWAVEPEDWFSTEGAPTDIILTGNKLLGYIKRRGAYPLKKPGTEGYRKWLTEEYIRQQKNQPQQELFPRDISELQEEADEKTDRELADVIVSKLNLLSNWMLRQGFVAESKQLYKITAASFDLLILVHPDYVYDLPRPVAEDYLIALKQHIGKFDKVITHFIHSYQYIDKDWVKEMNNYDIYVEIRKFLETNTEHRHDFRLGEDAFENDIGYILMNQPNLNVYLAGGYQDLCLRGTYYNFYRSLNWLVEEQGHHIWLYPPLIYHREYGGKYNRETGKYEGPKPAGIGIRTPAQDLRANDYSEEEPWFMDLDFYEEQDEEDSSPEF